MLGRFLSASALLIGPATAVCTRELLSQVASKFVNNVKNGSPNGPLELATPFTYTENFKDASFASGVFSKTIKIAHNRTLLDGPGCGIYVEIIAPDNKPGYHIGSQIFVNEAGKAKKMEAIINSDVPSSDSWYYNGTRTLAVISKEEAEGGRGVIPEAKRDARETLKQVADDYFSMVSIAKENRGKDKSRKMPKFAPGCTRSEGGYPVTIPCSFGGNATSSTSTSSSSSGAPKSSSSSSPPPTVRGYVIDETVGSVDYFGFFAGNAPDSHDFRVEGGLVRYVHAITVLSTQRARDSPDPSSSAPKGTLPKGAA